MLQLNSALMRASICSLVGIALIFFGKRKQDAEDKQIKVLDKQIRQVDGDRVDEYNNKKLVSFIAQLKELGDMNELVDQTFGNMTDSLKAQQPLEIKRNVEVNQWVEREQQHEQYNQNGNKSKTVKTYTYELQWRSYHVSAYNFKQYHHQRDKIVKLDTHTTQLRQSHVTLGDFKVEVEKVAAAVPWTHLNPKEMVSNLQELNRMAPNVYASDQYIYFSTVEGRYSSGDVRVSFQSKSAANHTFTVLGQQLYETIVDYPDTVFGNINFVGLGSLKPLSLLKTATSSWYSALFYSFGAIFLIIGFIQALPSFKQTLLTTKN